MIEISESYLDVRYDLRPAKQVERRMFIDALQILQQASFPIRDYQYTGMGSIYFVDYILLHKFLGIQRMLSVEISDSIKKRVHYNKPFETVELEISPIGSVIPDLARDQQHILWLDYDNVICSDYISDVVQAASHLSPGSILLVTLDAEPPGPRENGPAMWREHFFQHAREYLEYGSGIETFGRKKLPGLCVAILDKAIGKALAGRRNVEFLPLFNFRYADGHQMLTVGGMICSSSEKRRLRGSAITKASYYRGDLGAEPFEIHVPAVTRKERLYLDSNMPCPDGWRPKEFELSQEDIEAYREVYRFLPAYAELLL